MAREVPRVDGGDLRRPHHRARHGDIAQLGVVGEVRGGGDGIVRIEHIEDLLSAGFKVGNRHGRLPFRI